MNSRKLFIFLVTVAALLVLYIIYTHITSLPKLVLPAHSDNVAEPNMPDLTAQMGNVGTTRVGTVVKAVYTDLDKDKNVKREFGFERLVHESGSEWTIDKPYMNIIEKDFVCGITADTGKVQVEIAAGKPAPKDAKLMGNVIVHILPEKESKINESFAYLDDISFISEKSMFTTAGPVRFVSADAEMAGSGLEVIYNKDQSRLELLKLINLQYLRLKTFKESSFLNRSPRTQDNQAAAATQTPGGKQGTEQYYKCELNKNVVINYGSQTVLADEVTISNVFWPKSKTRGSKDAGAAGFAATSAQDANSEAASDEKIIPVVITCDNGIIVRPMEETVSGANERYMPQRTLELLGNPVTIKIGTIGSPDANAVQSPGNRVLAECGWLKYNLDLGVLDMFSSSGQEHVSLNLEKDGSKLETTNSLSWWIKKHEAVVRGPGTLYFAAKNRTGRTAKQDADKARMNFGGTMNVYFANEPLQNAPQQTIDIKSVSLAGGFTASMPNGKAHLAADSAMLDFAGGNAIAQANLDGNVNFSSNAGSLSSRKAKLTFEAGNTLSQADLDGGVNFKSDTGALTSDKAKVLFTKDTKGDVYASAVQSFGNVEVVPAENKTTHGVFRAQRIDYDIRKGYALADGPVELTFHTKDAASKDANDIPLTITAKHKAEYFLKSNEVIFEGDINGRIVKDKGLSNEYDEFHGDRLVAKLGTQNKAVSDAATANSLEHISITGDVVKFESYQKEQNNVLGGIKLKCRQVDYDSIKNAVSATGGSDCFVIIDNSKAPEPNKTSAGFNFKGPCFARLWDFENLQWNMNDNLIAADGIPGGMHIAYLPVAKEKYGQKVQIDTTHLQIGMNQTPAGRKEIASLKAAGGIHYLEENSYEFFGSELLYDGGKSTIGIAGDSSRPCMVNGVIVDSINYNLSDGSVQTQGLHGGLISVPPRKK